MNAERMPVVVFVAVDGGPTVNSSLLLAFALGFDSRLVFIVHKAFFPECLSAAENA